MNLNEKLGLGEAPSWYASVILEGAGLKVRGSTGGDLAEPATIWRAKLRSLKPGVDHKEQLRHCVEGSLIAIGWGAELPSGSSLDEVCQWIERNPQWGRRAAQTVRRFGAEAKVGDFIWTRDTQAHYRVCRITGTYRFDASPRAARVDSYQVLPVEWAPNALDDLDVPGAVVRAFVGSADSFSRIHEPSARMLTPYLWEKLHDREPARLHVTEREVLESHLDPYDVEDLIYVWLQVARGFLVFPRARRRDTPAYEWTMINRTTRRKGIVQVKTGNESVNIDELVQAADADTDTYAYSTARRYNGDPTLLTEVISSDDVLRMAREEADLLPARIRSWFDLASPRGISR